MIEAFETSPNFTVPCTGLLVDETCLVFNSTLDSELVFRYQSEECEKCDLVYSKHIFPNIEDKLKLKFASLGTVWKLLNDKNETVCSNVSYFREKSRYDLFVNESGCFMNATVTALSPFVPIVVSGFIYFVLFLLWISWLSIYERKFWKKFFRSSTTLSLDELSNTFPSTSSAGTVTTVDEVNNKIPKHRLRSLDTVRGISVILMIFVNYGGGKYWVFHHSIWNGLSVADVVFPWFIWIMGVSMALSLRSLVRKSMTRTRIFVKILKRSAILFGLGLMLNTYCTEVDLNYIRISGVLQRFSISYFVVAFIHLFYSKVDNPPSNSQCAGLQHALLYSIEWPIMVSLLILHIMITFLVHDRDCPAGYVGPGGLHDGGKYALCTGGAAGYIDRQTLGVNHLYKSKALSDIYQNTIPHDPEGLLGYLTSIFLVFLGLQAGKIILAYSSAKVRIGHWLLWFVCLGSLALLLCKASKDDGWIPINKHLWSASFIFATGSLAFLLMTICYYIIDIKHKWSGAPFYFAGMNPILLYVGHELTHSMFPFRWKIASNHSDILALNLWATTLWVIISYIAYRCNFHVTV